MQLLISSSLQLNQRVLTLHACYLDWWGLWALFLLCPAIMKMIEGYKEVVYSICVASGLPISITSDTHQSGT